MTIGGALDCYVSEYERDPDFVAEGLALRVAEQALAIMETKGIAKTVLANAMGVSPAFISRLFNAQPNLTLRTIARLAIAMGARVEVRLLPEAPPLTEPLSQAGLMSSQPLARHE